MRLYITENIEARILYIREALGHTAIGHYAPYAVAVAKAKGALMGALRFVGV